MKAKKTTKRRNWTPNDIDILTTMYPDHYVAQICQVLHRQQQAIYAKASALGLKKSEAFKKMELQRQGERLKKSGVNTRYQKGMVALNKGKAMSQEQIEDYKLSNQYEDAMKCDIRLRTLETVRVRLVEALSEHIS